MCSMTCFTWSLVFNRRSIWAHLTIFGDTMCTWRYNCANMEHQVFLRLVAALACVTPSRDSESELPTLFWCIFPSSILTQKFYYYPFCLLSCIYGSIGMGCKFAEPRRPWTLSVLCLALDQQDGAERETQMYSLPSIVRVVMDLHWQAK